MNRLVRMPRRIVLLAIISALLGVLLVGVRPKTETRAQSAQSDKPSAAAAGLQYLGSWGMKGTEPGHLAQPTCIATDALGDIFIPDAGSRFIHKFDFQGTPLLSFQDDWVKSPQSIAIDRGGAIYIADATRGGISVFLPSGDRYRDLKLKTRPNAEDILGVTVADDGLIFVLDRNANQVLVYAPVFPSPRPGAPLPTLRTARAPLPMAPMAMSTCSTEKITASAGSPRAATWFLKSTREGRALTAGSAISSRLQTAPYS